MKRFSKKVVLKIQILLIPLLGSCHNFGIGGMATRDTHAPAIADEP
jgi:hypothetical protein